MTNSTIFSLFHFYFSLLLLAPRTKIYEYFDYENSGKQKDPYRILMLGDSLTGYGVMESRLTTLLENKLNQEISPKTKINYEIINGGLTGSTSSGGVSRISWFLKVIQIIDFGTWRK